MARIPPAHAPVFDDEKFAAQYAKKHQKMASKFGERLEKKLEKIGFRQGTILDVGCGFGGTLLELAPKYPHADLIGIDLADPLLTLGEKKARQMNVHERVVFKKDDVHELPCEDHSIDVIFNLNMVHLVYDPLKMLNEIHRVLKSGGHYFISDLRRSWLGVFEREIKSALSADEAKKILDASRLQRGTFFTDLLWWHYEGKEEKQR